MELFEHQKSGIEFLKRREKAILADEMGLGKTRQAIVAAHEAGGGVLVVCPASLKINWKREIKAVYPDARVDILSTVEADPLFERGRWYVVNYDILDKKSAAIEEAIADGSMDTLILDEAHYIKGKSLRASCVVGGSFAPKGGEKVKREGLAGKMRRVYCLTGTPLMNRPIELFNLLRAIGHELGKNRSVFARRYCGAFLKTIIRRAGPPIRYMDESGATNLPELREHLKYHMLRRKKKDVLDLPDKIVSIMQCELTPEWQKTYDNAWDDYIAFLEENPVDGKNIDNILMARHLVEIQKLKQVLSRAKIERIATDVRNAVEQEQKVIVFSQYTETIRQLKAELETDGGTKKETVKCVTLTGADDMDERQRAVDRFQNDPGTKAFIANIKAGGVGLTLTEASIVMFADMEWTPEIHAQAEDRAHRIGQTGTVNIYYYVVADSIEDDIIDILNEKKGILDQVLEGKPVRRSAETMQEAFLKAIARKTRG